MHIRLKKDTAEQIGVKQLEVYGLTELGWRWDWREVDLATLTTKQFTGLYTLLEKHTTLRGVQTALWDMRIWKKAQDDPDQWARDARQMASLLKAYFHKTPGHRIFRQEDDGLWYCYYLNQISYVEKHVTRDYVSPAHVVLELGYEEMGGRKVETLTLYDDDCKKQTPGKIMAAHRITPETPELRAQYVSDSAKYRALYQQVGLQLETWGTGTDDLDGNKDDERSSWYWSTTNSYVLGSQEEPGRAVVDVFFEGEPQKERKQLSINEKFWETKSVIRKDDDDDEPIDDSSDAASDIEIPVHPVLATFDLKRHLRLRVHVSNCEVHAYDKHLAEKLVLRRDLKDLVSVLIEHKSGGFQDIIKGKSGGAVVMLAGPPGTGKTLTAEVYAESEERALYSVQCSQLGTKPDDLEDALLKCFTRCKRWNAVMLLDEADVYIHTRGQSLNQNAIVGVFLRVLEYQDAVLFLTTNRPEDVDDAVASRCVARLVYTVPSPEDQALIWKILAGSSGAKLADKVIVEIVKANPRLSGRDVKNLLKLAMLTSKGAPITAKMVEFVKQFKPTVDQLHTD